MRYLTSSSSCAFFTFSLFVPLLFTQTVFAQGESLEQIDYFENQVRPLLEKKCVACHSTESGKTNGGLSLSSRDGWEIGGDSGPAIIPGKPAESLVFQAVTYQHAELKMPPTDAGGRLSSTEIDVLKQWIEQGAMDPRSGSASPLEGNRQLAKQWWAFQALQKDEIPEVTDVEWSRSPIDAWVRTEQLKHGMDANPVVDKRVWLRRATYDLTGLPPTPQDIATFESDTAPDAYARVVDRLLDSPAYGERWGGHWLDIARYADTAGDGADYPVREAYRYRNWVIKAISQDVPIDRFIAMQIAGDILARENEISQSSELYADHITATGFLAVGKRYGYAPNSDYQHLDFADALDSIGRSMLGLSIGCARCHDHKYDPISMEDYYAWYGILQSTQWSFPGGEEHKRPAHFPSLLPQSQKQIREAQHQNEISDLESKLRELRHKRNQLLPGQFAGGVDLDFEQQKPGTAPANAWLSAGPNVVSEEAQSPFTFVHPSGNQGVRVGTGKPNDGVRYVFENNVQVHDGEQIYFHVEFKTIADDAHRGAYRFYLGRGVIASTALDISITQSEFAVMRDGAWKVVCGLESNRWYALTVVINTATRQYELVLHNGENESSLGNFAVNAQWDGVIDTFICDGLGHVSGPAPSRDLDNIGLSTARFSMPEAKPAEQVDVSAQAEKLATLESELKGLQAKLDLLKATPPYPVAYGVADGNPMDAAIQKRGEPDKLGAVVARRNLEVLGGEPISESSSQSGRYDLAKWLTDRNNPLTARVFVNRVWQWHFGQGLVRTPSDFGLRGEPPTHPELLDWLTSEFVESGWSLKKLHRLIMNSRVYQLSSADKKEMLEKDPDNRWLWKFQRRPLSAEELRDSIMTWAGSLDPKQPEGHPFPDVNTWAYTIHNPFHAVYGSSHRSVYLMKQRNRRHPYLALFDAADPNQSQAVRAVSTTPTQSLFLMNSPFITDCASGFAKRILESSKDDRARIEWAVETTTGFKPTPVEIDETIDFLLAYSTALDGAKTNPQGIGEKAWVALARVLLTSNAVLFVD
ncbi:MAG: PSD1 domain-containing protein [Planctomycetes bacterium]|nr:PSD1 domain-containing protein [Planctomycetota bacterium]